MTQQGIVPVPGSGAHATRNYETDQSAKLSVFDTGTSVSVGQTMSSTDEKWLRKIGAEQKLLDGLSVSGSVGETAQGTDQQEHQRRIQAELVNRAAATAKPWNCIQPTPQTGRDVVTFRPPDGS